jgi:hypothetical protein
MLKIMAARRAFVGLLLDLDFPAAAVAAKYPDYLHFVVCHWVGSFTV